MLVVLNKIQIYEGLLAEWLISVVSKVQQRVILVSKPLMVSYTKEGVYVSC